MTKKYTVEGLKKGDFTCMYCNKNYKRGKNPRCCNKCLMERDYCVKPNCNKYSILRTGYRPKGLSKEEKMAYNALVEMSGQAFVMLDREMQIKFNKWRNENEEIHEEDEHYIFNHCIKCFNEIMEEF